MEELVKDERYDWK